MGLPVCVYRLKAEHDRLKQQATEHEQLNNTLKLEMSIYDAMGLDTPHSTAANGQSSSQTVTDHRHGALPDNNVYL